MKTIPKSPAQQGLSVCFPFVGDDLGGSHISAVKLIKGLRRDGFRATVVVQQSDGTLADYLLKEGLDFDVVGTPHAPSAAALGGIARTAFNLPGSVSYIRRKSFDIVHTNDGWTHLLWGIAARLAGVRLVWHHRGDPDARGTNFIAPLIAHRLVAVSNFALPRRPILPITSRSRVIHSPFDHPVEEIKREDAHAMLTAELRVAADTKVLGYFGGLIERKRPLLFIEILHRVLQSNPKGPVVGCLFGVSAPGGRDLAFECLERAAALGISKSVRLMGFRTPIEPYMTACDLLLIPAMGEPFGRTLIEAMLLGTPVIATRHGGNPEAIIDNVNGVLVEPESAEAFVGPIRRLLEEPLEHERLSRTARSIALKRYGADRHVHSVERIYREICPGTDRQT